MVTTQFCEFKLVIYTSDGHTYNENGQTIETVFTKLSDYLLDYDVTEAAMGDNDLCGWTTVYVKE